MTKHIALFLLLAVGAASSAIASLEPELLAGYVNLSTVVAGSILIVSIGLAVFFWPGAPEPLAADAEEVAALRSPTFPRIVPAAPTAPAQVQACSCAAAPPPDIVVSENLSDVEQARLLMEFGQWRKAAGTLATLAERPADEVDSRFACLDGHPESGPEFNVAWPQPGSADQAPRSIESFPHVMSCIVKLWGQFACAVYLDFLLLDTREGTRAGFPVPAAQEIAFLRKLLDERLRQEPPAQAATRSAPVADNSFSWELRHVV